MKLSIIIPMFNVEKYIERCLRSCANQDCSIDDYEIIVVNDGSKDNSYAIAKKVSEEYSNIKIITQDNKGLSAARNIGFIESNGEYVWFVDSDDWIAPNCMSYLMESCNGCDVVAIGYMEVHESDSKICRKIPPFDMIRSGKDLLLKNTFFIPAQFYIYKKDFLIKNNLSFYEGIFHEDFEFTPRMLYLAKDLCAIDTPVYYYNIRANSITTTINSKKSFDLLFVANRLFSFSKKIIEKDCQASFYFFISICINNSLFLSMDYDDEDKRKLCDLLSSNYEILEVLKTSSYFKYKIEGFLFSLFPKRAIFLYKLLKLIQNT